MNFRFFKFAAAILPAATQAGQTRQGLVVVLNAALKKRDELLQLGTLEDELRLRLAAQAASCAAFDWNVAAGTIRWDGATDILPLHLDFNHARSFMDGILPERRHDLQILLESRSTASSFFLADIEIASALGAVLRDSSRI